MIYNLDIDLLIDLLSNRCSDIISKVWRSDTLVSGVFILEDAESQELGVSITTIVEYRPDDSKCSVILHAARVGKDIDAAEAAEAQLRHTLIEFAEENRWTWK